MVAVLLFYESVFWDLPIFFPADPVHEHSSTADKNVSEQFLCTSAAYQCFRKSGRSRFYIYHTK